MTSAADAYLFQTGPAPVVRPNDTFNAAAADLSDAKLRPNVDHNAQIAFMKRSLVAVLIGGAVCLTATLASSTEAPAPSAHHLQVR